MHHLSLSPRRENYISITVSGCQDLVRFFALLRIKPHAPPLVRAPVNSFEFQPCGRTPQAESLSVSCRPESRLRHWCSSIYLRIPPLHMEFHSPLLHSRMTVSDAVPRLSRGLSHQTYHSACARFTPNKSGQRLPPTYYRGCWHVVSRDFLVDYRQI